MLSVLTKLSYPNIQTFFTVINLTCHSGRSTGVLNNINTELCFEDTLIFCMLAQWNNSNNMSAVKKVYSTVLSQALCLYIHV